jgi:acyl phosphate:glycerol-3-phosphate acyltransferase
MIEITTLLVLIAAGYLLGSIPVAWLVTKWLTGKDLQGLGSGNVGVMNTALSVHRWAGLLVFAAELAKGLLAVEAARVLEGSEMAVGMTALATIVGTRYPIWLRGHGGRGNSAALGALALISALTLVIMAAAYLVARVLMGSNFLAMRVSLLLLPPVFGLVTQSWWWVLFGACFSLVFLSTHRPETDDHLRIKARYPTLWAFLTAPPRK